MTEEQRIALDEVWGDPCWAAGPSGGHDNDHLEREAEPESSARCSSMASTGSWSAESATTSTSFGDSDWLRHRETVVSPASSRTSFETTRTVGGLVEDSGCIDLGLDDWLVCEATQSSVCLQILSRLQMIKRG